MPTIFQSARNAALAIGLFAVFFAGPASAAPQVIQSKRTVQNLGSATLQPFLDTRVMSIGDSNTHGVFGRVSFRYPLWFQMERYHPWLSFVGTEDEVLLENGVTWPDPVLYPRYYSDFDRDHQSYTGITTYQVIEKLAKAANDTVPDVCIVMIGTNDIGLMGNIGVSIALGYMSDIIATIRRVAPATVFLVTTLPPIGSGSGASGQGPYVVIFNALLEAALAPQSLPHSPVVFVDGAQDMHVIADMQMDGLHVNEFGEIKMANEFRPHVIKVLRGEYRPPHDPSAQLFDSSFESAPLMDGFLSNLPLPNWVYAKELNVSIGVWNPDALSYLDATGGGTPSGANGQNVLSLDSIGGDPAQGWVTQTMSGTVQPNTEYALEVGIGQRMATSPRAVPNFGGYEIQLLGGNRVLGSLVDTFEPFPGVFETDTLVVDTATLPEHLMGSALSVRVRLTNTFGASGTDFDNFVLQTR